MRTGVAVGQDRPRRTAARRRKLAVLALAWLICGAASAEGALAGSAEAGYGYRFGVFPYLPALTIDRIFGPVAASFTAALGRPVYLKTKPTFEAFASELERATYDILLVQPFFYVEAADRHGYLPLARVEGHLTAVALVRSERTWSTWADLAGKTVATPPALAAVSELTRLALWDAGLVPGIDTTLQPYRTKVSCLRAVLVDAVDACVLPRFVLPQLPRISDGRLRIMAESRPVKHLAFAAHPRVPAAHRAKLRALILAWPYTDEGRAILGAGPWPGFVAARDADYDDVRRFRARAAHLAER